LFGRVSGAFGNASAHMQFLLTRNRGVEGDVYN